MAHRPLLIVSLCGKASFYGIGITEQCKEVLWVSLTGSSFSLCGELLAGPMWVLALCYEKEGNEGGGRAQLKLALAFSSLTSAANYNAMTEASSFPKWEYKQMVDSNKCEQSADASKAPTPTWPWWWYVQREIKNGERTKMNNKNSSSSRNN